MPTECNQDCFPFHPLNRREVRGNFDGGTISSDGGGLLLREVEKQTKILEQFAACFRALVKKVVLSKVMRRSRSVTETWH